MKVITVVADIKNVNFGDFLIFKYLVQDLKNSGYEKIYKLANATENNSSFKAINFRNPIKVISTIAKSTTVLLGGGGIIQDRTSSANLLYFTAITLLARLFKREILIESVGVTAPSNIMSTLMIKTIFKSASKISVRDEESLNILKKIIPPLTVTLKDDVVARNFRPLSVEGVREKYLLPNDYILFSLRPLPFSKSFQSYNSKAKLLESIQSICHEYNAQPVFSVFHSEQDLQFLSSLKLESFNIIHSFDEHEFAEIAKNAKHCYLMRLHAIILAHKTTNNITAIAYDDKITSYMKNIEKPNLLISVAGFLSFANIHESPNSNEK